jgi:hypothetical protein
MPKTGYLSPSQFKRIGLKEVKNIGGYKKQDYLDFCNRSAAGQQLLQLHAITNGKESPEKLTVEQIKVVVDQLPGELQLTAGSLTYGLEIVLDMIGVEREEATSASMEHGIENEPYVLELYEQLTMSKAGPVTESIQHPELPFIWGRPDALVGADGGIEIKCPWNPIEHLGNLRAATELSGQIVMRPDDNSQLSQYWDQIQGYLDITGRKWFDFVSYDPRYPEGKQLAIIRVGADVNYHQHLRYKCEILWNWIQDNKKYYL